MIPTNLPPGTKIVCINDSPNQRGEPTNVVKGQTYTLKRYIYVLEGDFSVLLEEISPPEFTSCGLPIGGYYRYRFKLPVENDIFDQLLDEINNMTPEELEELEHELELDQCREELEKAID